MPVTVIVGLGWGDEGKGRVIDFLAPRHEIIVRFNGGANAGHTVKVNDQVFRFHNLPSGMLYPKKICVIAHGVVVDVPVLKEELKGVRAVSSELSRLYISDRCHLVLPYHKLLDHLEEEARGSNRLGTTGCGIGPVFEDKVGRKGIRVSDIFCPVRLKEKLERVLEEKNRIISIIHQSEPLDLNVLARELEDYAEFLRPFVIDTMLYLQNALKEGKSLLMEGAQGSLLDHEIGTYPFVTSTSPVAGSVSSGAGIGPRQIGHVAGVLKAYATRVGAGPFPTELQDAVGEHLRKRGNEYGTTTGRPRRCGWFDLPLIRYACYANSPDELILTKLDVLSGLETIKVCVGYRKEGVLTESVPALAEELEKAEPIFETLPGWKTDLSSLRRKDQLPQAALDYISFLQNALGVRFSLASVGPAREEMIPL